MRDVKVVFVDLDKTLIRCNSTFVEYRTMTNENGAIRTLQVFLKSKAFSKSKVKLILSDYSRSVNYEAYFSTVVAEVLMQYHNQGFKIVLATGAMEKTALAATEKCNVPIFDYIYSTASHKNKGSNKLDKMVHWIENHQTNGFDYIGDAFIDLQIMKKANNSVFVGKPIVFTIGRLVFNINNFKLMRDNE